MTIQQLRYVTVICDEGSLNKASEQLYIAQPSLTSALQELEKEIGITIFNRGGRGVKGMQTLAVALDKIYKVEKRKNFILLRVLCSLYTFVFMLLLILKNYQFRTQVL